MESSESSIDDSDSFLIFFASLFLMLLMNLFKMLPSELWYRPKNPDINFSNFSSPFFRRFLTLEIVDLKLFLLLSLIFSNCFLNLSL